MQIYTNMQANANVHISNLKRVAFLCFEKEPNWLFTVTPQEKYTSHTIQNLMLANISQSQPIVLPQGEHTSHTIQHFMLANIYQIQPIWSSQEEYTSHIIQNMMVAFPNSTHHYVVPRRNSNSTTPQASPWGSPAGL